jgi:hypothetical protein
MARKSLTRVAFRPESSTACEGNVQFDSQRLMTALTFHVRDEAIADEICETCVTATLRRLTQSGTCVSMSKARWFGLTNSQRFEWLLASSHTELYCSPEGKAMFRQAR